MGVRAPYFIIFIIIITLFYVGFYPFLAFPLWSADLHRCAPVLASLVLPFEPTLCATRQPQGHLFRGSLIRVPVIGVPVLGVLVLGVLVLGVPILGVPVLGVMAPGSWFRF